MTQWQIEYAIAELQRRAAGDAATIASLESRILVLEGLLLNVPSNRLLGRYATTAGIAQNIRLGAGLEIQGDRLVNTGGGSGAGAITSFTLICVDDATEHEVTCVLTESGHYVLRPNQSAGGSGAVASKTLVCQTDFTDHLLRLRFIDGYYNVEIVQSPGGSGAVNSILMTASDLTEQTLICILEEGYYTWTFS